MAEEVLIISLDAYSLQSSWLVLSVAPHQLRRKYCEPTKQTLHQARETSGTKPMIITCVECYLTLSSFDLFIKGEYLGT